MAPRDPSKIQLDDPALVDQTIRDLSLLGTVGMLNFADEVVPVYLIGDAGITLSVSSLTFDNGDVYQEYGANPVAGEVINDTGQLTAGVYDVRAWLSGATTVTTNTSRMELQHRNAGNTATISSWGIAFKDESNNSENYEFAINILENERLRVEFMTDITGSFFSTTMAKRRIAL